MLWLTYAVVVIAAGIAVTWMMRPHNETKCKECQAIAARLEQRKRGPSVSQGDQQVAEVLRIYRDLNRKATENSASAPSSESAPPSTHMPIFLYNSLTNTGTTGVSLPPSHSGKAAPAVTPVVETPTESGPAGKPTATRRGKRESKL